MDGQSVRRLSFVAAATLALTFAFVLRVRGEWVWDDVYLVEQNRQLVDPGGLRSILTHDLWGGAQGEPTQLYHPIPVALHWLEAALFGVSLEPMRLVNVLLHTLNGALLFVYVRRLGWPELAAQTATVIFLLHPSVTEPVMWLSSHDLPGVAFTLAAMLAVTVPERWGLAAVFCALAFMCKELFVVTPVLLLLEPLRQRRFGKAMLLPFVAVAVVLVLRRVLGIRSASDALFVPVGELVRCAGTLLVHYSSQVASFGNGLTTQTYVPISLGSALLVLLGFGGIVAVLVWRKSPAGSALAWFGVALAPNVIALPFVAMFGNRYAYLPLVGFALLIAYGVSLLEPYFGERASLVAWVTVPFAFLLALPTAGEASQWASAVTLYGADVERAPNDPHSLYHYGHAVFRRQGCREALPFYERSIVADPTYQRAWHNIAGCLINERRYSDAIGPAQQAVQLAPDDARAEYNLGIALGASGRKAEAIGHLERAHALKPSSRNIEETLRKARE